MFGKFGAVCFRKPGGKYWWACGSLDSRLSRSGWHFPGTDHLLIPVERAASGREGQITRSSFLLESLRASSYLLLPFAFLLVQGQLNTLAYLTLGVFFWGEGQGNNARLLGGD